MMNSNRAEEHAQLLLSRVAAMETRSLLGNIWAPSSRGGKKMCSRLACGQVVTLQFYPKFTWLCISTQALQRELKGMLISF
jgi:hypothetical protein